MERLYKFLKILIILLTVAVLAAAFWRFNPSGDASTSNQKNSNAVPNFTVYTMDGEEVQLSDFLGKPIVLNFWASWCGPCKAEMPDIEESYKTYGDQIHFLIVNLTDGGTETVETASAYIASQGYTFPLYYDTAMEAAYAYGISAIPTTFFIGADGALVHQQVGMMDAETLQKAIDLLLN